MAEFRNIEVVDAVKLKCPILIIRGDVVELGNAGDYLVTNDKVQVIIDGSTFEKKYAPIVDFCFHDLGVSSIEDNIAWV